MGLNFSIAFNSYMREIINEKRIEFKVPEIPNTRLVKVFKQAEKDLKNGKFSGPFTNHKDFEEDLMS
jgi:antitoxin component of RelBE/YafQ-DinJ toxin-antitoxin module